MPPFLLQTISHSEEQAVAVFIMKEKRKTANHLVCGLDVSDMIRTRDLLIRSQTLYPAELHSHIRFEQNIYYSMRNEMSITFLKNFKKFG